MASYRLTMSSRDVKHVLFICSQNKLRSPTAEQMFADVEGFEVMSAGLNNDAEVCCTAEMVEWADTIFVMEPRHRNKLRKKFKACLNHQRMICLDIPDEFEYMDQELISMLNHKLGAYFGLAE